MCVYLKAFYIHLANRMQLPFTPTHQDSQVFIRRPLSLQCCYALPGSFAGCFIFRHLLMVVYGQLKAQRPSYSGDSYVRVRGLLPGLPWGWHFNPHTHPIPTGIPMGIPIPTAALPTPVPTTDIVYGHDRISIMIYVNMPCPT